MTVDTMVLDKVTLAADQLWMYSGNNKRMFFGDLINDDKDLIMFTVESLDLLPRNEAEGVEMRIVLKRKITTELMTTFLPTLLLLLLTFSGTCFRMELFGDAMAHNLTIMLVMTTIFTSKIEELPPTSDLKMVDIWLILCLLVPFIQMVLCTCADGLRQIIGDKEPAKKKEKEVTKEYKVSKEGKTTKVQSVGLGKTSVAPQQEGSSAKVTEQTTLTVEPQDTKVITSLVILRFRIK